MNRMVLKVLPALVTLAVVALVLVLSACDLGVEKPEKDSSAPLGITIERTREAPDYHNPLEWWTANHPRFISEDVFSKRECMLCHVPDDSCNKCHEYVGAELVRADGR
jgi:hypothetical protein